MADRRSLTLELDPELREAFLEAAKAADVPAEAVLRDLVLGFVERQRATTTYEAFLAAKIARARSAKAAGAGEDGRAVEATFARRRATLGR